MNKIEIKRIIPLQDVADDTQCLIHFWKVCSELLSFEYLTDMFRDYENNRENRDNDKWL